MFTNIESNTADDLWLKAVDLFRDGKSAKQSSRAGITDEVLHAALCLHDPRQRWVVSRSPGLNPAFAMAEVIWMLRGRNDSAFLTYFNTALPKFAGTGTTFHGAYGFRLRRQTGVDQLARAYQALRSNSESRQVVMQIWDSSTDLPSENGDAVAADIPCNVCAMLKVRSGKLDWMQIMRSNDLFRGLPYNLVQFTSLHEIMAGWLGVELGSYHHVSDSLHIYEDTKADVLAASTIDVPKNVDSLAATFDETDSIVQSMESLIMRIIDEHITSSQLIDELGAMQVPAAWMNMASVLAAEGIRKRRDKWAVDQAMANCLNPVFTHMYARWMARVSPTSL